MGEEEKEYPEHKDSAEKALPSEKKSEECAEKEYPSEIEHLGKTAKEVNLSMERSKQNGKVALFVLAVFAMLFSFVLGGASCYFYYFSYPGFQLLKSEANGTKQEEINLPRVSKKLGELQDLIHDNYLYTENGVDAENGIYKGLLNSLLEQDPYAQYYTKEEIDQTVERQKGVYQGIGASVSETPDGPKIEFVYAGSPAEKGGLKAGDLILKVDGISVKDLSLQYIVQNLVQGVEGSSLEMIVERDGAEVSLRITRGKVVIPAVEYGDAEQMVKAPGVPEGEIGYLSLRGFYMEAVDDFIKQYETEIEGKKKALVIDLRGNPGGDVDAATKLLDYFLPDDLPLPERRKESSGAVESKTTRRFDSDKTLLLYTEDKKGDGKEWYASDGHEVDMPLVILVNQNSASASELFSGAMQDYQRAYVLGTQSYGKGIVQTVRSFPDGSAVEFTTHYYFTPARRNIHKVGITPDYKVEIPEADSEAYLQDRTKDVQLKKAVETLSGF